MSKPDPLVVVLGAGASKEVGLPIGSELTKSIADSLTLATLHGMPTVRSNPAVDPVRFALWALCDKATQRQSP